jgi:hypothetical protein
VFVGSCRGKRGEGAGEVRLSILLHIEARQVHAIVEVAKKDDGVKRHILEYWSHITRLWPIGVGR